MIDVWNLGFDQFQGAFLSTGFLALELALFQQFLDDAGSLDGKKQDLMVAQSAKDDSATGPLQHHQFETPVDYLMMWRCFQCQLFRMTRTSCIKPGE